MGIKKMIKAVKDKIKPKVTKQKEVILEKKNLVQETVQESKSSMTRETN